MPSNVSAVPALVGQIYEVVAALERLFPDRKFTPDGHLLGSIGEVLAAEKYDLDLLPMTAPTHDAVTKDGRRVQIKTTQSDSVGLRDKPDFLLVLFLARDGEVTEVYNGPGDVPWNEAGKMQKNGQRSIGIRKVGALMRDVPREQRI